MSRSIYKGVYLSSGAIRLLRRIKRQEKNPAYSNKSKLAVFNRSTCVVPKFLGITFKVHNGNRLIPVTITQFMFGHKLGEFSFTKAMGIKLHKRNRGARKKAKKLLKARQEKRNRKKKSTESKRKKKNMDKKKKKKK